MEENLMYIINIAVPIIMFGVFVFLIATSSRKKDMEKLINDFKDMEKLLINDFNDIINENENTLKNISTKSANIEKDGIEIRTRAIKDGFTKEKFFCKNCGEAIDSDSNFCKKCGKQQ